MSEVSASKSKLPPEQEAIRAKCFHPSGTFVEFPIEDVETSVPQRFDKIAKQYPERIAVKTHTGPLTFEAVNKAANCVSHAIFAKLGNRVDPVVLFSRQDLQTIVCGLAVLKAGKILVAVDPDYPVERIKHIVENCRPQVIVAGNKDLALASNLAGSSSEVLNPDWLDKKNTDDDLGLHILPDAAAEIRYSSGSTGSPKGTVRTHRRLLYSAMSSINSTRICPEDRLLVLRNMSFGIRTVLRGLLAGAEIFPFEVKTEGLSKLSPLLSREQISMCAMASTTFRCFVSELSEGDKFPSMRLIHLSAERLTSKEITSFKKHFIPGSILLHTLSAGEAGNICQYFIDHQTTISTTIVPIGYPIKGKEVFILDDAHQPLGIRESGEIAVRSRYLSSEYWGNPDLTDAKFLADPRGGDQRIYLTGDLGRMLPDGCVVHLGRKDLEVKIRGNRVAIAEVEAILLTQIKIEDVAVAARQDSSGETYLAAYIVPLKEQQLDGLELIEFLKERLPDYMIPTRFVFLAALPTVNGKLDRQALPEPNNVRPEVKTPFVRPRTAAENELAMIWCDVLSLAAVGVNDNFFDLGGHSLAAMRVVSQVLQKFQLEVPFQSLFQSPTVASMAAVIAEQRQKKLRDGDLDKVLEEIESISDEEARRLAAADESKG